MGSREFWAVIGEQLDRAREARTAADVVAAFKGGAGGVNSTAGDAFFAGGGGGETVWDALDDAGWVPVWSEASYYYAMRAPNGDVITYVEGDIYVGDRKVGA